MKLITKFKETIGIYNINKWEDPIIFEEVQKAIANAFEIPDAQDHFDDK